MTTIRRLPPELVNQIAAGEVIERPASALKELVENALDAGAQRVEVAIEEGGKRLIRVIDDGSGIAADQLELAVSSHATSKLSSVRELFSIRSLGFRGEALASIGSVSELRVASRTAASADGAEIRVSGGKLEPVRPAALAPGTVIEVRNLFFNTPARRKFLSSAAGEARACARALMRLALASPTVGFRLEHDGRVLLEAPPVQESESLDALRVRVTHLFGRELAGELVPVEITKDALAVRGLAALPPRSRGDTRQQFVTLAVQGGRARPIRDKLIAAAIKEGYRGLLMTRRHAIVFLDLEIEPEDVDVNVHPAKLEVRFRRPNEIFGAVVRALREGVERRLGPAALGAPAPAPPTPSSGSKRWDWRPQWRPAGRGGVEAATVARGHEPAAEQGALEAATATPMDVPTEPALPASGEPGVSAAQTRTPSFALERTEAPESLQLTSGYLVIGSGDGFEVIDPHALHERILYERFRRRVEEGALEVQTLLMPVVLELNAEERAILEEVQSALRAAGFVVEPFGEDAYALHAYPALLEGPGGGRLDLEATVRDALAALAEHRKLEPVALLERVLATLACKAAVKLGERLGKEEIEALLRERALAERSALCPHGRPSALRFSGRDLERQFRR